MALYAAETWTILKTDIKRIEAFERWLWKRSVGQQKLVILVLSRVMEDRCIVTIKQRKRKWLGHVLHHDVLLIDILKGRMLGKRIRGRKRRQLMSNICEGISYKSVKKRAEDILSLIHI